MSMQDQMEGSVDDQEQLSYTSASSASQEAPLSSSGSQRGFTELQQQGTEGSDAREEDVEGEGSESYDEEEKEDVELLTELRELYKEMSSSFIIDVSSESLNSTRSNDPEYLRRKVEQLQHNVQEWKDSYDLLMNELRKLKLEKIIEREELVKEVKVLHTDAKDLQQTVRRLESELAEHQNLLKTADSNNQYLLNEVNSLRKERGMREVELSSFTNQVNALNKDSQLGRLAEEDLGHVIHLIDRGINEGVLKLSELNLGSQMVPFSCQDVSLGPCSCGPLLERYKEDLDQARLDLEERVGQLEVVKLEVTSLQKDDKDKVEELESNRNMLKKTIHERNFLEEELSKRGERIAYLELEMKSLQDQLEASRHKELSLDDSLTSTTESLKHVQDLTEKHLELKEEELAQLKSELSGLEEKHVKLEEAMVESLQNVDRLERAHRRAQEESQQLREELEEEQRENGRKWESMNEDKEKIQRKLKNMVVELECQVKLAEQYKVNSETVQQLHTKSQEEARKLRAHLLSKETELSRTLTALQVVAGQIASLQRSGVGGSPRSSTAVSHELSECEAAVQEVENELRTHRKQWEELCEAASRDSATIRQLTTYRDQLEQELGERRENIKHLEDLLQEVGISREKLQEEAKEHEEHIQSLQEDLEKVKSDYHNVCQENLAHRDKITSLSSIQDQQQLLVIELEKRHAAIQSMETTGKEMEHRYQTLLDRAKSGETSKAVLQDEYSRVQDDLARQEGVVAQLEQKVHEERAKREQELEEMQVQLEQEQKRRADEVTKCSKVISELKEEFKSKTERLESCLKDEHSSYVEVQQLLEEKEKAIKRLEEETQFLSKQHLYTKKEVEHSQQLVESLQEDLASSKGRCDGLEQAVSEYERKLQNMVDQLHVHKHESEGLQDQVVLVSREVEALQSELDVSASSHHSLLQEEEERSRTLQEELADYKSQLGQLELENRETAKSRDEKQIEIEKLQLSLEELALQKEDINFQLSSCQKTIQSLKSQVSVLEDAQHGHEAVKMELILNSTSLSEQLAQVKGQLSVADDHIAQHERSKAILEQAGAERLKEIQTLTRELEELKMRTELVSELRERVQQLEEELAIRQGEMDRAREKVLEAERSHADIHRQLNSLEQQLTAAAEKEGAEEELRAIMDDQERELSQLREQCFSLEEKSLLLQSEAQANTEKEHYWRNELSQLSGQLELTQQKVYQLESELGRKEREIENLEVKLRNSQRLQDLAKEEASSGHQFEETLQQQLTEKRTQVLELERQLGTQRGEIATIKGKLTASDEERVSLKQRVIEMEEECDRIQQCRLDIEQEMRTREQSLEAQLDKNHQLQEDCRTLTEKLSSISKGERSSNDVLIQQIREMEAQIVSLKSAQGDLELRNDLLMQANSELKSQLNVVNMPGPLTSASGSSLNGAGPSSLSLRVDVDITNLPSSTSSTLTTGTSTMGVASAMVPLRFDSQYRRTMESAMSTGIEDGGHFGGSETESEAALDKDYWVRRAGELSIQLQQSSEYWAQKVRELSIDLEKQRQVPRHVDYELPTTHPS